MSNPYEAPITNAGPSPYEWQFQSPFSCTESADRIEQYFLSEKYKLESGTKTDGHYGIGNNVLRILFGAFVKRYRFRVLVAENQNGTCQIVVEKGMTGISGGAIGYSKLKKELERIRQGVVQAIG